MLPGSDSIQSRTDDADRCCVDHQRIAPILIVERITDLNRFGFAAVQQALSLEERDDSVFRTPIGGRSYLHVLDIGTLVQVVEQIVDLFDVPMRF